MPLAGLIWLLVVEPSSLQLPAWRVVVAATLVVATLGDVLQLTSSENWRLNFAATVQPSRLLPLAAFSISAVATFRVPRPSGDGYNAGG